MTGPDIFQRALALWRLDDSVRLLPPATDEYITDIFATLRFPLSDYVRQFYGLTSGFADDSSHGLWLLWPLDHLYGENENNSPYLWFSDFLICSHVYGLHYIDSNTSAVYVSYGLERAAPHKVASSLEDFFQKYLYHPHDIEVFNDIA